MNASNIGATFVESLAGTGKRYVMGQLAPDTTEVHVQLPAPGFEGKNRSYGYTFDVEVSPSTIANIRQALGAVTPSLSKAGTRRKYLPIQVTTIGYDGKLHFQASDGVLNRRYGLAFTVPANDKDVEAVASLLDLSDYAEAPAPAYAAPKVAPKKPTLEIESNDYSAITILDNDGDDLLTVGTGGTVTVTLPSGDEVTIDADGNVTIDGAWLIKVGADGSIKLDGDATIEVK